MDWSKIPDILAVASLACAFASILRRDRSPGHHLWLIGWFLIVFHFVGAMISTMPGLFGMVGGILELVPLVAAGIFFMWATVPFESGVSSRLLAAIVLISLSVYTILVALPSAPGWAFDDAAVFVSVGPLTLAVLFVRQAQHTLRWITVIMHLLLGASLVVIEHAPWGGTGQALNAILFTVYMECCIYFWYTHRRRTAGSFITISGFLAWALVFVVGPCMEIFLPSVHLESEVWNLPKYVVAVGMLLLLLETQIERSQYLALHDDLTKLANRRLFQDRLNNALERSRRSGTSMALLQIDLDRFKEVNDTHGHHVGDMLLKQVARMLDGRVRRSDTLARTGGDEFSLILEESSSREQAESVAQSLAEMLSEPLDLAGRRVRIGASIGVAVFPDDAADADGLCIAADMKMYEIKQNGREALLEVREMAKPVASTSVSNSQRTLAS
jgi:diguanylate cyclase (GGDEF)-like protein